jgi:hypothetical protein
VRVYVIDDYYWWLAPNKRAAIRDYHRYWDETVGGRDTDLNEREVRSLTDDELDTLLYDEEFGEAGVRTFREELARRIERGAGTEMFACTEF